MKQFIRLALLLCFAGVGVAIALVGELRGFEHSLAYGLIASSLLCFGLYMAVYDIDKQKAKQHWLIVVIAITVGVICKYLLIFGSVFAITQDWRYAVLAMTMAQIDPLSIAALSDNPRMQPAIRTVLSMWASFDDPMTALLTPLLLGAVASITGQQMGGDISWQGMLLTLSPFILLLVVVWFNAIFRHRGGREREGARTVGTAVAIVVAIPFKLFSLAAVAGWVFRPKWIGQGRRASIALSVALYGATFLLGLLLAGGVNIFGGVILGVATYLSQCLAAWLVVWLSTRRRKGVSARHFSTRDTWHLALSQQNGITAIVLALNLEVVLPGSVAVVSIAILCVNVLHFGANAVFDTLIEPRFMSGKKA